MAAMPHRRFHQGRAGVGPPGGGGSCGGADGGCQPTTVWSSGLGSTGHPFDASARPRRPDGLAPPGTPPSLVIGIPRQPASSGLELPCIAPSLRGLERHPGPSKCVPDRVAAGLEDALGVGATRHGGMVIGAMTASVARHTASATCRSTVRLLTELVRRRQIERPARSRVSVVSVPGCMW